MFILYKEDMQLSAGALANTNSMARMDANLNMCASTFLDYSRAGESTTELAGAPSFAFFAKGGIRNQTRAEG